VRRRLATRSDDLRRPSVLARASLFLSRHRPVERASRPTEWRSPRGDDAGCPDPLFRGVVAPSTERYAYRADRRRQETRLMGIMRLVRDREECGAENARTSPVLGAAQFLVSTSSSRGPATV